MSLVRQQKHVAVSSMFGALALLYLFSASLIFLRAIGGCLGALIARVLLT
jgi:hypothetical protein